MARFDDGAPLATSPVVGQHTAQVLGECGYATSEIAGLAERGVIAVGKG
jgi:crotonobetainyl-CoA:carnitine CoA-transferase CaiB-like acyl-CoA transferase